MADAPAKVFRFPFVIPIPSLTTILLLAIIGYLGYKELSPKSPIVGVVNGHDIAVLEYGNLLESRAKALDAARTKLDSGATLGESQSAAEAAYDLTSKQLFMQGVWPSLSPLFPTGDADATPAQKAAISKVFAEESAALRKWK